MEIVNTDPTDRLLDQQVSALLKAAPAYRALPRPQREALHGSLTKISHALLSSQAEVPVDEVNFPKLVEDLVKEKWTP